MTPEELAEVFKTNCKIKIGNEILYEFYDEPYVVGYIINFVNWNFIIYNNLVLGVEQTTKIERSRFYHEFLKFLNLKLNTKITYMSLNSNNEYLDKYISEKRNHLYLLGARHGKVCAFVSYKLKSKSLSDEQMKLYKEAEKIAKASPNILPTDTFESKLGAAILEITLWKYLEQSKYFKY